MEVNISSQLKMYGPLEFVDPVLGSHNPKLFDLFYFNSLCPQGNTRFRAHFLQVKVTIELRDPGAHYRTDYLLHERDLCLKVAREEKFRCC